TGGYSHTTGVYRNTPPHGGFESFRHHEKSTIATLLHADGYRTGLFGKYLNHYAKAGRHGYVPPGWDRWVGLDGDTVAFYADWLNVDGRQVHHARQPRDYSTNVLTDQVVKFIRATKGPLFAYFA